jgi:sulfoxide reductase heme-binding subunit YedZ
MGSRLGRGLTRLLTLVATWRYFKPTVFVGCMIPGLVVAYQLCQLLVWQQPTALGPDPNKTLLHETGEDALGILLITLCVTPVRRLLTINRVQIVRRMLGVWAFAYAVVHVSMYLVFDQLCYSLSTCQVGAIWDDVLKRKFIFAGLVAFTILLLLAVTSTSGWVRRLKKRWQTLHRLVYVAAVAAIVHYVWIQKSDYGEPLKWAAYLALLLGLRVYLSAQKRRARRPIRLPARAS